MHGICMGREVEFAGVLHKDAGNDQAVIAMAEAVNADFACVPEPSLLRDGHGFFLSNGSRWYIDTGCHPEYAGPECSTPRDVVIWEKAGERIMEQVARRASQRLGSEVAALKNNSDPIQGTTWGCHESILYRPSAVSADTLRERMVPFLATRPIWAGAGAISPDPQGMGLELSARARFLQHECSDASTHNRGIWHTKNEPLCDTGWGRLHNLSGDSTLSEFGSYLRCGTFALLVKALEMGCPIGEGLGLRSSLAAMKCVSRDFTGTVKLELRDGRHLSPVEVQREYLRRVRPFAESGSAPGWAADICNKWEFVLRAMEESPDGLCPLLDCHAKRAVYGRWLEKQGLTWPQFGAWAHVIEGILRLLKGPVQISRGDARRRVQDAVPEAEFARLEAYFDERSLAWDNLFPMYKVYRKAQQMDACYADVRQNAGGFYRLRAAGFLKDRLVEESEIQRAMHEAPAGTRAQLRGHAIKQLSPRKLTADADWSFVRDGKRVLRLDDPFAGDAQWGSAAAWEEGAADPAHLLDMLLARSRRRRTSRRRAEEATPPGAGDSDV